MLGIERVFVFDGEAWSSLDFAPPTHAQSGSLHFPSHAHPLFEVKRLYDATWRLDGKVFHEIVILAQMIIRRAGLLLGNAAATGDEFAHSESTCVLCSPSHCLRIHSMCSGSLWASRMNFNRFVAFPCCVMSWTRNSYEKLPPNQQNSHWSQFTDERFPIKRFPQSVWRISVESSSSPWILVCRVTCVHQHDLRWILISPDSYSTSLFNIL